MQTVRNTPEILAGAEAEIDWAKLDAMTDDEIEAAAAADPDTVPLIMEQSFIAGRVRVIRKRTGLTQEAFAARYGLSLGILRDWEQGAVRPDSTALASLRAIENQPDAVAAAYAAE